MATALTISSNSNFADWHIHIILNNQNVFLVNFKEIRIRANGKSGGHNGIKSIIRDLGTEKFNRLKIGIRHPKNTTVVSWVLTPFNDEQQKLMDNAFDTSVKIIDDFIAGRDSQYLMNKYN